MKTKMIALCLALVGWGAYAQHDHAAHGNEKKTEQNMVMFKDPKLGKAYDHYLHVKDALVASKSDEAKMGVDELQNSLREINGSTRALEAASKFADATDLEEQRKVFSALSNEMAALVKDGKLSMGMIYLDYCPMAKASWLSNEKEIKNPYFGEKMLTCGSVEEMIH